MASGFARTLFKARFNPSEAKHLFLKSHVLQASGRLPSVKEDMAGMDLLKFYEDSCTWDFRGYVVEPLYVHKMLKKWGFDKNRLSPAEKVDFEAGETQLEEFSELYDFLVNVTQFNQEIRRLYSAIRADFRSIYPMFHRKGHDEELLKDIQNCVQKYHDFMEELNDYPEWKTKVEAELGYRIHLLYQRVTGLANAEEIFEGWNKQQYFK
eukprot:CAMPEP_0115011108 /NCGR_PEP_ID=MMETSP0216-20121206/23774_1 /TAXON_ID=223996 /ORGANISM="Protocruzia adherens, Strain Boccale" /LENGTH=208 /DNA_ID=CAMNT_0002379569 /DNA_START=35 /DNA_END=661 /DNA_ORIENTATION=+